MQESAECYHEIHAIPLLDPVLDKQVIMLVQVSVCCSLIMKRHWQDPFTVVKDRSPCSSRPVLADSVLTIELQLGPEAEAERSRWYAIVTLQSVSGQPFVLQPSLF